MLITGTFTEGEEQLHDVARQMTGLNDFGSDEYRVGLRLLLESMDRDLKPTAMGREFGAGTVVGTLAARLHAHEGWKRDPQCLQKPIVKPLVITGIPRTGTTALHKLLSMDPQFQGLEHWLADVPMPRPRREEWERNTHYRTVVANLDAFFRAAPEMRAAHEMTAHEVDECLEVLKHCFVSNRFASGWNVPSYDAWFQQQDERPAYRYFANTLRLIGAHDDRVWLLKNPGHIAQLDALLEIFPDARVVQTHRDPGTALPSLCSVLKMSRVVLEGDAVDSRSIGPRECRYWHEAAMLAIAVRQRSPSRQFFDVDHRRFHAEPMRIVHELYDYYGLTLSAEAEAAMRRWIAANPANRLGEHRYAAADFGLDPNEIRAVFREYMRHFDLHGRT